MTTSPARIPGASNRPARRETTRKVGFIRKILKKIFKSRKKPSETVAEALRVDFQRRYHHFKLLLNANHKSLEIMAEIQQTLYGQRPFGMIWVRATCTAVSVNVFRMINHLEHLAPGKYHRLGERFSGIQKQIDGLLKQRPVTRDGLMVISLADVTHDMADQVGSKMATLGELGKQADVRIPAGFVITAAAYRCFVEHNDLQTEIDRRMQSADVDNIDGLYTLSAEIQQLIIRSEVPGDLCRQIQKAWQEMERREKMPITAALRSSALGEDAAGSSFAGQYRSELNVSAENLFAAYKEILASKYSLAAISYRLNRGFRDEDVAMCVGCMIMVDARMGGVVYSANPVDAHDRDIFVNAAWGLPKSVVDGSDKCDLFVVSRKSGLRITKEEVRRKSRKFVCYPKEGVCRTELVDETRDQPSLDHRQVLALSRTAMALETYYGCPQDIEWAIDEKGRVFILQCRPLRQSRARETGPGEPPSATDGRRVIAGGGVTASPGAACGTVFRIEKDADLLQFPSGAVLVARQALPRWASLLNRAAAVVTEQGGFAGHLANVAREFGVPAVFGVNRIMEQVQNGLQVTVDADACAVYAGRVDAVLTGGGPRPNPMAGSTVYQCLQAASRLIVPLNLLDPDAPGFAPANCNTFHDITRFIHEKAVLEMFNFGREHDFTERSSKQLHYNVPMQWWVLNLDDGFKKEVGRKYVHLENIVSIPMLAFWEGFAAVPWDGPPGMDGKGLMSVMFQSTTNPALNAGVRSRFAERNYFMISKHFCTLSSRLGYHFSTMEAMLSERGQ